MKLKSIVALTGSCGAMILCGSASAVYTGLSVSLHTSGNIGGQQRNVWRVYANFNDPNDYLIAVAGSNGTGNLVVQSRNSDNSAAGGSFFNPLPSNGAPNAGQVFGSWGSTTPVPPIPNARWETFATIGIAIANSPDPIQQGEGVDNTSFTPGSPAFISGNSLESNNIAWFTAGPVEQGRAGHWANNRVLIMQLTTSATSNVRGTVAITGMLPNLTTSFSFNGQTFNSLPAPAALALFGLATLVSTPRRRAGHLSKPGG